ncbi:U-box domain-containing protein 52 isoform X1 [Vitis vinifera]|nr:U-box domain-containing protein 52 isoform X1 [Vitis vinifera]|eukprot:XP_010654498.1 PREDICTED: U-box domain-containing protein 52 isoform X1 [Vitis vinifera]
MASQQNPPLEDSLFTTIIAIDKDKSSQYAVKWAVDNLLSKTSITTLIHVRSVNSQTQDVNMAPKGGRPPTETEMQQLFLPFRGFCARKGIEAKEVVLHDLDIASALVDYISNNSIGNIVVGASNRSVLTRKFRNPDVPTCLAKSAPESCAVYVISKGKIQSVRSAIRFQTPTSSVSSGVTQFQTPKGMSPRGPSNLGRPPQLPTESPTTEDMGRSAFRGSWRSVEPDNGFFDRSTDSVQTTPRDKIMSSSKLFSPPQSRVNLHHRLRISENSSHQGSVSGSSNYSGPSSLRSSNSSSENLEFSGSSGSSLSSQTQNEMDAEMNRLKLELKQSMDAYNSASKEAMTATQRHRARDIHQRKTEEARRFPEARIGEETALAIVELEKQKSRKAMQAAQMAQRLAELEAHKRKNTELKAKREAEASGRAMDKLSHNDIRYRKYTIEDIEVATDYFSNSLKIGEGGYGPVYKGSLDHTPVAIKVLRPDVSQGLKQFKQEVEVLSCMRHPNMVLLVGACPEYGCLVYEYMENGSLDDRLFRRNNTLPLPWATRFKIASEIASALLFLHQTKPAPLVHRDLKPANILLGRNYVSKISDVGLARLVPASVADSVTQYHMTAAAGTFCYIDPEYQQTGMLGVKSDVYSLGVLLLQIITAKPPMGLTHQVARSIERGTFAEMLDPTVEDWPVEEALSFAKMALNCCELRKKDRPDLGSVVLPELNRLRDLGLDHEGSLQD